MRLRSLHQVRFMRLTLPTQQLVLQHAGFRQSTPNSADCRRVPTGAHLEEERRIFGPMLVAIAIPGLLRLESASDCILNLHHVDIVITQGPFNPWNANDDM